MHPEIAKAMTEADLLNEVVDMAFLLGWLVHHTRPARTAFSWRTPIQGNVGFPDLVLAHPKHGVVFLEVKREGRHPTEAQLHWINVLNANTPKPIAFWARPSDMDWIEGLLRTGQGLG